MLKKLNTRHAGFTLVEIMIVVAIIALLAAIAVPNFLRSRKRSQATQILEDMRILQDGADQYYIEHPAATGIGWEDIIQYVKTGSRLYNAQTGTGGGAVCRDLLGNGFMNTGGGTSIQVVVNPATFNALSDVAPAEFWSPYR